MLKDTFPLLRTYIYTSPYHSFIFSGCLAFWSVVVWKGLRRNNVNCWPECFSKEVIESYYHKLMLFCKVTVLKEAAMIVLTTCTLADHFHFYCIYSFKARITTPKRIYTVLKFLNCEKKKAKQYYDCRLLRCVWRLAFKGLTFSHQNYIRVVHIPCKQQKFSIPR